jgi:transcriptional regulator with XRE-family HTH domain
MDIHARLKRLRLDRKLSLQDVGRELGVSWQTIQLWESTNPATQTAPKRARLQQVADFYNVTTTYLLDGEDSQGSQEYIQISLIDTKLSAGTGQIIVSQDESKKIAFRTDFITGEGYKPEDLLGFRVEGDSMVDAHITSGATVVVNRKLVTPKKNKFFALWIEDKYLIKELVKVGDAWVARSHNKARASDYPDILINTQSMGIIGQAFWVGFML